MEGSFFLKIFWVRYLFDSDYFLHAPPPPPEVPIEWFSGSQHSIPLYFSSKILGFFHFTVFKFQESFFPPKNWYLSLSFNLFSIAMHLRDCMNLRRGFELWNSAETVIDYGDFWGWTKCILHYEVTTSSWGTGRGMWWLEWKRAPQTLHTSFWVGVTLSEKVYPWRWAWVHRYSSRAHCLTFSSCCLPIWV